MMHLWQWRQAAVTPVWGLQAGSCGGWGRACAVRGAGPGCAGHAQPGGHRCPAEPDRCRRLGCVRVTAAHGRGAARVSACRWLHMCARQPPAASHSWCTHVPGRAAPRVRRGRVHRGRRDRAVCGGRRPPAGAPAWAWLCARDGLRGWPNALSAALLPAHRPAQSREPPMPDMGPGPGQLPPRWRAPWQHAQGGAPGRTLSLCPASPSALGGAGQQPGAGAAGPAGAPAQHLGGPHQRAAAAAGTHQPPGVPPAGGAPGPAQRAVQPAGSPVPGAWCAPWSRSRSSQAPGNPPAGTCWHRASGAPACGWTCWQESAAC